MTDGFDLLQAKLTALTGDALARAERKALRAVGKLVKDAIVERAPEQVGDTPGGDLAPGALKADIRAVVHIASDVKAATDVSRVTIGPGKDTAHIARFVEDGHANARYGGTNRHTSPNTPAHPFVRPAADATREAAVDLYASVMTEEVQKAMNT